MRRAVAVRRQGERRLGWLDQIRRDHNDQLGLVPLELIRAEQLPEDRYIAERRDLGHVLRRAVLQQAGQREAFAAAELDRGLGPPDGERRYAEAINRRR